MKLAMLQMDVRLADASYNREQAAQLIRRAADGGADTVVLPETWNLGFFPTENLDQLAEPEGGESKELLCRLAAELQVNIVGGSLVTARAGRVYNTAYIIDRQGSCIAEYDKIHGFSPSGEHLHFAPGDRLCTFTLDSVKAGIVLCYDLRFCELVRSLRLEGIEMLFVPAHWPKPRIEHWKVLNRARAIENQMYVCCVNGCGQAGDLVFGGHSMLIEPFGDVLAEAGETPEILFGKAELSILDGIRSSINVMRDRRPDLYRL